MIFDTKDGKSIDSEIDLTAPERHILQKLFLWKSMSTSLQEFRQKKTEAFQKGWNNSGPVVESPALRSIINDLETQVVTRLKDEKHRD